MPLTTNPSGNFDADGDVVEGLSRFFQEIWGEIDGYVYLPTLDRKTGDWQRRFFHWPEHEKDIIRRVLAATASGLEAYYSPAIYKSPKSAAKENVLGTSVLWAEFDGDAPEQWDGHRAPDGTGEAGSEAPSGSDGHLPTPSIRVQSSADGHEHVYWKLDEFTTDIQWLEDKNRSITYSMRSDTSGWDVTQILRPPFTTNYKRNLPVTVITENDSKYSTDIFEFLKPPMQLVSEVIDLGELPTIESIIAKYPWDKEHFELFRDPQIEEGKRSHALMRIGYFCAEVGMTDTEAYAVLLNADERWGKYKGRSDRKKRLLDIINRARQKHPTPLRDLTFAGLQGEAEIQEGGSLIYGFRDFLESDVHVEWAIKGLIEKGGFGLVASMPGVGKTQFSIQLAMACALGENFFDWEIEEEMKILFLSLEMSHVALKIFMETIAERFKDEPEKIDKLQKNLIIVPLGEAIAFDKEQGMKFLFTILDEVKPDGIIIDSVGKLSMEELNEKTAKVLNHQYHVIRNRYGSFLWLIHHNRKASENNKKPTDLSDVYGNQYITAEMTSVLVLWRDTKNDEEIEVIPVKMRLSPMVKPFKTTRDETLKFIRKADNVAQGLVKNLNEQSKPAADLDL